MAYVRTIAIWISGLVAAAIFGGVITDFLIGHVREGGILGAVGGPMAFICFRLWVRR